MVAYVQRLEAIQLQRELWMHTEDEDDEAEPKSETNSSTSSDEYNWSDIDEDARDDDEDEDEDEDTEVIQEAVSAESGIYYPQPKFSIAKQPTVLLVSGQALILSYGAADLIWALHHFLLPIARHHG
ncbi:hypothetical protein FRC06_006464, partial [Ceratobasidium sp. 370]